MKPKLRTFVTPIVAASLTCVLPTTWALAADIQLMPLVTDVLWVPKPVLGSDEQYHLVYELRLANPTPLLIIP
jgi:hypothetical protein